MHSLLSLFTGVVSHYSPRKADDGLSHTRIIGHQAVYNVKIYNHVAGNIYGTKHCRVEVVSWMFDMN